MSNTPNKVGAGNLATLMLAMGLAFSTYFAIALAVPVLPVNVHQALASVPSLPLSTSLVICDSEGGKGNRHETCCRDGRLALPQRFSVGSNAGRTNARA